MSVFCTYGRRSVACRVCTAVRGSSPVCGSCREILPWTLISSVKRGDTVAIQIAKIQVRDANTHVGNQQA